MRPLRVMVSAAEASADRLGGALLDALAKTGPIEAAGMGGASMRATGFEAWQDASALSVVGLVEVVGRLPGLLRLNRTLARQARAYRPDIAVLIDAPDFHLRLARSLRRAGIPVVLYVPPAVWASRPGRVRRYAAAVDGVLVLFPFEARLWSGVRCVWVGHPLTDAIPAPVRPPPGAAAPVALVPGSRPGELQRHLPILRGAAEALRARGAASSFVIPLAAREHRPAVAAAMNGLAVELVEPPTTAMGASAVQRSVARARGALVTSGTATLETALVGCPQVAFYRLHPFTYAVARRLKTVDHWALPNVLLEERALPERIQDEATAPALAEALIERMAKGDDLALDVARRVRARLGPGGAAARAAEAIRVFASADQASGSAP